MTHDPLPRPDGLCACGCGHEVGKITRQHLDPFATSTCARRYHGVRFKHDLGTFGKGKRRAA